MIDRGIPSAQLGRTVLAGPVIAREHDASTEFGHLDVVTDELLQANGRRQFLRQLWDKNVTRPKGHDLDLVPKEQGHDSTRVDESQRFPGGVDQQRSFHDTILNRKTQSLSSCFLQVEQRTLIHPRSLDRVSRSARTFHMTSFRVD
jgi:hypothetical protein